MVSLKTVMLWTSVFLLRQNYVGAIECEGMNFRYDPEDLVLLTNCTSILGSLTIVNINIDNNKYQFPNLTEITGYLIINEVQGINSIGSLFPNLMVIRGKNLALSYALIIFRNRHLQLIDLKSLVSIQRGFVYIQSNPTLCYHNTIDWEALTDEDEALYGGRGNVIQAAPLKCPTRESCRQCDNHHCWSSMNCQKNKYSANKQLKKVDGCHSSCLHGCVNATAQGCKVKCHELCLGGCVNSTAEGCHVCLKWKWNGKCVEECPSDLFLLRDTLRCVSRERCINSYKMIPLNGECRKQCPVSFSKYHPDTKRLHPNECFKCKIKCPNVCNSTEVRGPTELENLRDCHIVEGSLLIRLNQNLSNFHEQLEETLGNIETINGALKIYRSFTLTSLSFFRNLNKINAQNATASVKDENGTDIIYRNPYALEIADNENLQTLFDWREKRQIEIIGGGMFIHHNSKLCMSEIHNLQKIANYNGTNDFICNQTNGYEEVCHATGIEAYYINGSHSDVRIYWNMTDLGSDRRLIGYFVYYIEAPSRNITYYSGLDACSTKKFRPLKSTELPMLSRNVHNDFWESIFVPFEDLKQEQGQFVTNLTNLKPFTQYAYYVRTQISVKVKDQLINVTQGQSHVNYFKTLPDRPRPPIVRTRQKTNVSLTLEWIPSTPEDQLIERYIVDVYALEDDVNVIDERNYCHDPKETVENKEANTDVSEVICCRDQRAYLKFFQRNLNQTCYESDPTCEKSFKLVLFHHHVENALLRADLDKDPSKRYQYKVKSYNHSPVQPVDSSDGSKHFLHSHVIDNKFADNILVPNLKPFNLYAFHVYACNSVANCSDYFFHSDRTKSYIDADDVSIVDVQQQTDSVTLVIKPPAQPNVVTVSYEIESSDFSRFIVKLKCITRLEMEALNYTIRFEKLLYGTHSFRIRSFSFGEDGNFSDWVIVEVDQQSDDKYTWGIALTFICIVVIVVMTTVYRKVKAYRNRTGDTDFLLSDRRYSDGSAIQPIAQELKRLKREEILPKQSSQSFFAHKKAERTQQREPSIASLEGIPMTVFKSNVDLMLSPDQYSADPIPISIPGGIVSTQSAKQAFVKQTFDTDDPAQQNKMGTVKVMEKPLLHSPSEHESPFAEYDHDFSLFPPF